MIEFIELNNMIALEFVDSFRGTGGQQGQLFSYFRPRTRLDVYRESAVPAVPRQSLRMRRSADISSVFR